jgi:hypothetical protein
METKKQILDKKFIEANLKKGWLKESENVVLDAMEEYANVKINNLNMKRQEGYYWVKSHNKLKNIDVRHIAHFVNGGWYIINFEGKLTDCDFIEIDETIIK